MRRQFGKLYQNLGRARRSGLLAARTLGVLAATAKNRTQARRAVSRFRRAFQGAFRIAYSARSRAYQKLRSLAKSAAASVAAAFSKVGTVNVTETATGAAAKAFAQAKAALATISRAGSPMIGGGVALWTGRTQQILRGMAGRFERMVGQAASALNDLARALR